MHNYLDLCDDVLTNGKERKDRTGTGTISVFGRTLRFDLQEGFPIVTTKRVPPRLPFEEMLWMISGTPDIRPLQKKGITIWDAWADPQTGRLGPVYGVQWRHWDDPNNIESVEKIGKEFFPEYHTIDQLQETIDRIKSDPYSRRHLISAWNVADLRFMKLPPCHYAFQFYVRDDMYLDCMVQMRSVDVFLGLPFDIAGYAFLTHMVAHLTDYEPGELIFNLGDTHIYTNHVDQVKLQLQRRPKIPKLRPELRLLREVDNIDSFRYEDFELLDYVPQPGIKGDISV